MVSKISGDEFIVKNLQESQPWKWSWKIVNITLIRIQNIVRDKVVSKISGDEFIVKNLQESHQWKWSWKIASFTLICIQDTVMDTVVSEIVQKCISCEKMLES